MKVLVTGATGYIGSHTIVELQSSGYEVVAFDNLSNSCEISLDRVKKITGKRAVFVQGDIRDDKVLDDLFTTYQIDAVMHFAGLKSVEESIEQPLMYYENNVFGTIQLLKALVKHNVKIIIFSSSATVYGAPIKLPLNERMSTGVPTNPYGMSKLMIENILADIYNADKSWSIARLRYFNPAGAHSSGLIGENPKDIPNNLIPFITQTAIGRLQKLIVYGNDYPTIDGSGVRDYIHVVDLAKGHVSALEKCLQERGLLTINLGTGKGYSVLEIIDTFEKTNKVLIPYEFAGRRAGDIASCYGDVEYAKKFLKWSAKLTLEDICRDSWRWQTQNPDGYEAPEITSNKNKL